ncbi:MAG TPA: DUF1330 domain-containing protein [Aestuariivirgaceae bacterium]|jgi:uncharacterized protein (DUF1330 family)
MAAYVIVDTKLTNPEAYEEYKVKARPIIETFGGIYRARGGKLEILEEELWRPSRLVVIEFPSMEQALKCLRSSEYLKIKPLRHANARSTVAVVEGV